MKTFRKIYKFLRKNKKLLRKLILLLYFGSIGTIYFHNVTRDVYSGDIGDLVTAAWVFGVAHPPGYPLFTFLGHLFTHYIPGSLPPVSKMALISVIASLVGLIFFYKFAFRVTKNLYLSFLSTSILAFSYLFWIQAEIPEVFGLNNLFIILILYYSILFYEGKKAKDLYLLVFLCGLSLTHHQTILFIFPTVLLLVIKHFKFVFLNPKRILIMSGIFILGLLPYIYVPIAASHNPVINWNNASNLNNFIKLISRSAYGDFAPPVFAVQLDVKYIIVADYFKTLVSNYSYQIIFIFFLGLIRLFQKNRYLLFTLFLAFFLSGPFFIFYCAVYANTEGHMGVIERFYVASAIIFMFFVTYGFLLLNSLLSRIFAKKYYVYLLLCYFLIIPYLLLVYNYPKTNLSTTKIGQNLVIDMFKSIPNNSILLLSGDTPTFNSWYMHYVLGFRKDIIIINSKMTQANNYIELEKTKYKKKHPGVKDKELNYLTFEELRRKKKIFTVLNSNINSTSMWVPRGLVYELIYVKDMPTKTDYEKYINGLIKSYHIPKRSSLEPYNDNLIATEMPMIYSEAIIQIATFFSNYYKDQSKAEQYYKEALSIDNQFHHAYAGIGVNLFNKSKDCKNSILNMKKAIELYPIRKDYYQYLFIVYKECNVEKRYMEELRQEYKTRFKINIEKEIEK